MSNDLRTSDTNDDGGDFDPVVAQMLGPLTQTATPDVWTSVDSDVAWPDRPDSSSDTEPDVVDLDSDRLTRASGRRWLRPMLMAAAVVLLVATVAVLVPRPDQRVESPADQAPTTLPDGEIGEKTDDGGEGSAINDVIPPFPDGVEIGPDRTAVSSLPPSGSFILVYGDAGSVVVKPSGEIMGHYPGPLPLFLSQRPTVFPSDSGPGPAECRLASIGESLYFCVTADGPTVEAIDSNGRRLVLASFSGRGSSTTRDLARFVEGFFAPGLQRGRPLLLELAIDLSGTSVGCNPRHAMVADNPIWTTTQADGGTIRNIDGSSVSETGIPIGHQSRPLGWSDDGEESFIWQYNSTCHEEIEIDDGVYAFTLAGESRMLFPIDAQVTDVLMVDYSRVDDPATVDGAAESAFDISDDYADLFDRWAGPLVLEGRVDAESLLTDPRFSADAEMMMGFVFGGFDLTDPWVNVTDTEPRSWIIIDDDLALRVTPNLWFGEREPEPNELNDWDVATADTFLPADDDNLSASVGPSETATWTARFFVPGLDSEVTASYEVEGTTYYKPDIDGRLDDVELVFELEAEPVEPATLSVSWRRFGELVAFKRVVIPPGEFNAG